MGDVAAEDLVPRLDRRASAMMLAAVPVNANSTSAPGESKAAFRASAARRVTGSAP